jgi:hypothetical protein
MAFFISRHFRATDVQQLERQEGRSLWLTKTAFFGVLKLQICHETMDIQITELILGF